MSWWTVWTAKVKIACVLCYRVSPDGADVPEIQSRDGLMKQGKPFSRPDMVNVNRLKVLGGSAKGMKIDSPDVYLRPMMAKV